MPAKQIVLVEDENDILELLSYNLQKEGYQVCGYPTAEKALDEIRKQIPDLIVLDLMLPGMDGFEFCRIVRMNEKTRYVPIIMLTAKGEESDIVTGLELGADDYITKPFSPKVLIARIRTIFRRSRQQVEKEGEKGIIRKFEITLNPAKRQALVEDKPLDLTFSEFQILHFLLRRPGWVFTRNQIIDAVHGEDYPVTDRSVDVQIVSLRKKLGKCGKYIDTVRGVGYRFKEDHDE
jgi:two-component system phosphate regulon response regulator PhoB